MFDDWLFQRFFQCGKHTKKTRTGRQVRLRRRVRRSADAAGEVRRGKPSRTSDLTLPSRTTPAPRWGTANLNRCARSPYPRGTPQSGLLRLDADPGDTPAEPDKPRQDPASTSKKVSQNLIKIWSGRVPRGSRIGPGPSRKTPERRKCKKTISGRLKSTNLFCRGWF